MEELHLAGGLFDLGKTPEEIYAEFQNRGFRVPLEILEAYKIYWGVENKTEDDFTEALHQIHTKNPKPYKDFTEHLTYLGDPYFTEILTSNNLIEIDKENPFISAKSLRRKDYESGTVKMEDASGNKKYYSYQPRNITDIMEQDMKRCETPVYITRGLEILKQLKKL